MENQFKCFIDRIDGWRLNMIHKNIPLNFSFEAVRF